MRVKSVDMLNGGEILAEPVLTEEKEILIPKGTRLKADYLPLIQSLGIDALAVEDPYENLERPHSMISPARIKVYVEWVQRLMEKHMYHTHQLSREYEVIAHELVKEINDMPEDMVVDLYERTADLYEHTVMVTLLSVTLAKRLHLDRQKQHDIAVGSLLHDLGIRYITVKYENRDWRQAEPAEVFEFKKHTILGYSALEEETWIPDISRKMVLSHHERQDGSGFPMHQKNRETECRILQVCDSFDCCISGMECKRMSVQDALMKISTEADIQYEQRIVNELVSMIAKYPAGTTVKIDDETEGVVISQTKDPENPVIMVPGVDSGNHEHNLMLEKNISILRVM